MFYIKKIRKLFLLGVPPPHWGAFSFMFKIALHIDDSDLLIYLSNKLGLGSIRYYKDECIFNITSKKEIAILINILDKFNLNTSKLLDYRDWIKAYFIYFNRNSGITAEQIKDDILNLKNNMNTKRVDFNRPDNFPIIITKSWLFGFIEGDGS